MTSCDSPAGIGASLRTDTRTNGRTDGQTDVTLEIVQCSLVIVALVIVDSLIIVDKTAMTEFLLSNFSRYSGFSKIS